jgi:hypothetical protein
MGSSFLSERSTEYVLIPKFSESLYQITKRITPIFFWTTREGASHSKASFKNKSVVVVALYARRPKVLSVDSNVIELKFNDELFSRSEYLVGNGIPVFAGAPLVSKLDEFYLGASCKWFNILPASLKVDEYIYLDKTGRITDRSSNNIVEVTTSDIINIIQDISRQLTWDAAVNIIKNNKYNNHNARWYFGGGYKPVYFILDTSEES